MSDLYAGFYTTTTGEGDTRVNGGCGHLHRDAADAVTCALAGEGYPVRVARCGKSILPMDGPLSAALEAALGTAGGGRLQRLLAKRGGSGETGGR